MTIFFIISMIGYIAIIVSIFPDLDISVPSLTRKPKPKELPAPAEPEASTPTHPDLSPQEYELLGHKDTDDLISRLDDELATPEERIAYAIEHYDTRHGMYATGTYSCCVKPENPRDPEDYFQPYSCCHKADRLNKLGHNGRHYTMYKSCDEHPDFESRKKVYPPNRTIPCPHTDSTEWRITAPDGVIRYELECYPCENPPPPETIEARDKRWREEARAARNAPVPVPAARAPHDDPSILNTPCCWAAPLRNWKREFYYVPCKQHISGLRPDTIRAETNSCMFCYVYRDGNINRVQLCKRHKTMKPVKCKHINYRVTRLGYGGRPERKVCSLCGTSLAFNHNPQEVHQTNYRGEFIRSYVQCPCGCVQ